MVDNESLSKQTVKSLRELLRAKGLQVSGNKEELINRLLDHKKAQKKKKEEKKSPKQQTKPNQQTKTKEVVATVEKKTTKVSPPAEEKTEKGKQNSALQRAARLGLPVKTATQETKEETKSNVLASGSTTLVESIPEAQRQKLRAERFETKEFLIEKRKQRFGDNSDSNLSQQELKKKRLERFGTTEKTNGNRKKRRNPNELTDAQALKKQRIARFGAIDNPLDPIAKEIRAARFAN